MGLPRGQHRALDKPPKPEAAARFRECLRVLETQQPLSPEEMARIEREAQAAPYRRQQLELPV